MAEDLDLRDVINDALGPNICDPLVDTATAAVAARADSPVAARADASSSPNAHGGRSAMFARAARLQALPDMTDSDSSAEAPDPTSNGSPQQVVADPLAATGPGTAGRPRKKRRSRRESANVASEAPAKRRAMPPGAPAATVDHGEVWRDPLDHYPGPYDKRYEPALQILLEIMSKIPLEDRKAVWRKLRKTGWTSASLCSCSGSTH